MAVRAPTSLAPIKILAWVLASIGKPIYFLLSRTVLALIFIFYATGHVLRITSLKILRAIKSGKPRKKQKKIVKKVPPKRKPFVIKPLRIDFSKIKLPKIKFLKIIFPKGS